MEKIIVLEGSALKDLLTALSMPHSQVPYRLRLAVDDGQVKFKINEEMWSPPLGPEAEPTVLKKWWPVP